MFAMFFLSVLSVCWADCVATCNKMFGLCVVSGDFDMCRSELDSCLLGCTATLNLNANVKAADPNGWAWSWSVGWVVLLFACLCLGLECARRPAVERHAVDRHAADAGLCEVRVQTEDPATEKTPLLGLGLGRRPKSRKWTVLICLASLAFVGCLVVMSEARAPALPAPASEAEPVPAPVVLASPCPGCFGPCCPDGVCCPLGVCTSLPGINGQCCEPWYVCYDPLMHQSSCCGFMGSMCVPGKGCRDPSGAALQSCSSDADCWGDYPHCKSGLSIYSWGSTCQR
jgi:hypothetical protein